jgi:hypothetical protein
VAEVGDHRSERVDLMKQFEALPREEQNRQLNELEHRLRTEGVDKVLGPEFLPYAAADRQREGRGNCTMKIHQQRHPLRVTESDVSGSVFDDVNLSGCTYENVNMSGGAYHNINLSGCSFDDINMSGWKVHNANLSGLRIDKANLAGASIVNSRLQGMTIDGIEVTELIAAWHEREAARKAGPA